MFGKGSLHQSIFVVDVGDHAALQAATCAEMQLRQSVGSCLAHIWLIA
jgi:hypothetical protein